tara:strand:- start:3804 stop:4019 length:216 start_codon:yes stop_codon:yes gene_type:complete
MPDGSGEFFTPENLKKWAIDLANSCGGARVVKSPLHLDKANPVKANKLLEQFAVEYNNMVVSTNEESKEEE